MHLPRPLHTLSIATSPRARHFRFASIASVAWTIGTAIVVLTGSTVQAQDSSTPTASAAPRYPETERRPVEDTYVGTAGSRKVVDDYRWLESLDAPAVKDWVTAQNSATRRYLDGLPMRVAIRDELRELIGRAPVTRSSFVFAGGKLFALKRQPPRNQRMLVVLDGPEALASERVVVDPNLRNDKGTTAIDWYVPSHDGRLVAVSLSDNGSERGTLRIFETETGAERPDIIPRVQLPSAGGSVAWNGDASGLWYTRYPAPMERPKQDAGFYQQVWFHKLGTRATFDTYAFGRDLPKIAEIRLESSDDGRSVLAQVRHGDGGDAATWVKGPNDQWRSVAGFGDGIRDAHFGRDDRIYAIASTRARSASTVGVPVDMMKGRIVAMRRDGASLARASTVVPESDLAIERYAVTASRIYVEASSGGPTELRVHGIDGRGLPGPISEAVSNTSIGARLGGDALLYATESYLVPSTWSLIDPARNDGRPVRTSLSEPVADLGIPAIEVKRVMARSKDGTQVPVNLVMPKGLALDGSHPVLLTAYGGYGISTRPRFSRRIAFWLRHGGLFAQANVRGGNEFGDRWHRDGKLVKKQNVFDDFAAAARTLIDAGYTRPSLLAIEGGSNGGLLMGAELAQHPELFGAVVGHVGVYDMLRAERTINGEFNTTEYGSVRDPAQFDALHAYSPVHRVEDGRTYPPVLLLTGINDGRVDPWHSFKMAARLQAASPGGQPVLLRVAGDAGHGQGMSLSSSIEQDADVFAFLFDRLGMTMDASVAAGDPAPAADPSSPSSRKVALPPPIGLPAPQPPQTR